MSNVKPGEAPTLTPLAAASEDICVTVLNIFVPSTVLLLTPVIVSVWAFPFTSVPVIVKVTEAFSEELDILIVEFKLEEELEKTPSIVKFPAIQVFYCASPSGSLGDSATFTSPKLLVSDKLTVILDKSVLYVAVIKSCSTLAAASMIFVLLF